MGERFQVRIDLARIQSNMLRDEGGKLSERQIRNWLISAGFTPDPQGGGWTADRDALRQLDRSELLEATPLHRQRTAKLAPHAKLLPGRGWPDGRADSEKRQIESAPRTRKSSSKRLKNRPAV